MNGIIYKIVCNITGLVYIGSTCKEYLSQRLQHHKTAYKSYLKTQKHYTSSFKILENDNYDIVLLELFPCDTKEELHARERHYMETIECLNIQIVGRTIEEWKVDNKDKFKGYGKTYYSKHKETVKDKALEYYEKNKEKIKEKRHEPLLCICGTYYTYCHRLRHEKSIKHQLFLNQPMK